MALKFYYNDTTYSLADFTASDSTASIFTEQSPALFHYYQNTGSSSTAEHKIPASSTRGTSVQFAEDDNYYYKMNNSAPTLCFRKNDTTFYCAKSITSEAKITYAIPAGTYTPSAFETLIKNYISANSSRTVANAFTVTVNNQTVSVSSGDTIYYKESSSSPNGYVRSVAFGDTSGYAIDANSEVKAPEAICNGSSSGFTDNKVYVTYIANGSFNYQEYFKNYANYNITVTTGINFN